MVMQAVHACRVSAFNFVHLPGPSRRGSPYALSAAAATRK